MLNLFVRSVIITCSKYLNTYTCWIMSVAFCFPSQTFPIDRSFRNKERKRGTVQSDNDSDKSCSAINAHTFSSMMLSFVVHHNLVSCFLALPLFIFSLCPPLLARRFIPVFEQVTFFWHGRQYDIMFPLIPADLLSYLLNSFICSHSYQNRCFFFICCFSLLNNWTVFPNNAYGCSCIFCTFINFRACAVSSVCHSGFDLGWETDKETMLLSSGNIFVQNGRMILDCGVRFIEKA